MKRRPGHRGGQRGWRWGFVRGLLPVIAALGSFGGCGGARSPVELLRPPLLPVAQFGSTVSVASFEAAWPDYAQVAGTMKRELEAAIRSREPHGVKLKPFGGGLVVHGVVERYAMSFVELARAASCTEAGEGDGRERRVVRSCSLRKLRWKVWVSIQMRVRSSGGRLLYQRRIQEMRDGFTPEVRDAAPTPPNLHALLKRLRQQVVERMARVVAPQRQRVAPAFRPCPGDVAPLCERARVHFAASRFAAALADQGRALRQLERGGADKAALADVHWNRALVARQGRDYGLAIDELERARRLRPGDAVLGAALADVAREQREDGWLIDLGLGALPPPRRP